MMSRVGGQSFVEADGFGLAARCDFALVALGVPPTGTDEKWTPVAGVSGTLPSMVELPLLQAAVSRMAATGRMYRRTRSPLLAVRNCCGHSDRTARGPRPLLLDRDD